MHYGDVIGVLNKALIPEQNSRHFSDNISKCIFFNENQYILIQIYLNFDPKRSIDTHEL